MLYSQNFLWALSLFSLAQCSSIVQPRRSLNMQARQAVDCNGLQAIPNSNCWDTLNITDYLNDTTTGWGKTTPTCQAGSQDSNCCLPGEAWSTCFLRLAGGTTGAECTTIGQGVCQGQFNYINLAGSIRAKVRYVVGAIVAINNFFTTLDETLIESRDIARNTQTSLSEALNFQGSPINQSIINYTLTMGPSFLYSFAATLPTSDAYGPAHILTQSLQFAPAVSRALWPNLTNTTTPISHNASIPSILSAGLGLLMRDIPTFVAFANHGLYSSAQTPEFTPTDDNAALVSAAQTYSTSTTLKLAGWYAVLKGQSTSAIRRDYNAINFTQGGVGYSNSSGAALYESPTTKEVYAFRYGGVGKPALTPIQLLNKMDTQGWANLEVVFDGAANCTARGGKDGGGAGVEGGSNGGGNNRGGALVDIEKDGTLDFACLSRLPAFLACGGKCPTARRVGGKCPFAVERGC